MHSLRKSLFWLTIFSVAMGFLESAVVIYLRALYYPHGFTFPLTPIPPDMADVEFLREAATIVMLLSIGIIAGKNTAQRFSFFIYSFAVWDICYYIFLKLFVDWPPSFFTWDILFIIPIPWVGPVLAPCIVSLTMMTLTLFVIIAAEREKHIIINFLQWALLIAGSLIIVYSFTRDYLDYISNSAYSIWTPMSQQEMFDEISHYIPKAFNWWIFAAGEILVLAGIVHIVFHHKILTKTTKRKAAFTAFEP